MSWNYIQQTLFIRQFDWLLRGGSCTFKMARTRYSKMVREIIKIMTWGRRAKLENRSMEENVKWWVGPFTCCLRSVLLRRSLNCTIRVPVSLSVEILNSSENNKFIKRENLCLQNWFKFSRKKRRRWWWWIEVQKINHFATSETSEWKGAPETDTWVKL